MSLELSLPKSKSQLCSSLPVWRLASDLINFYHFFTWIMKTMLKGNLGANRGSLCLALCWALRGQFRNLSLSTVLQKHTVPRSSLWDTKRWVIWRTGSTPTHLCAPPNNKPHLWVSLQGLPTPLCHSSGDKEQTDFFFFFLLPKEQIKTARFCWFQMQSFGFCDFFSLLKGILMNNTDPFVPRFPFLKRLCQDNIIHQGENVSTGGCSSFAEGLPCLFLNRNWALSKHKFLFQSKCPWVPQHLLFSGNVNFILVPKLSENERNHFEELRLLLATKWSVETVKMFSKARHLLEKWKFHKLNNGRRYTLVATEMGAAFWNRSLRWEKFPCWDAFLRKL